MSIIQLKPFVYLFIAKKTKFVIEPLQNSTQSEPMTEHNVEFSRK